MSDMDNDQQAHDDLLNWMQLEALGLLRREKITTSDFKENDVYTPVSNLQNARKKLGANYKPAKQGQSKIVGWQNVYQDIQDDGTATPGDLRSVNEGLGQTHRAKLLNDDRVRGDRSTNGKAVSMQKNPRKPATPHRVARGRIVKGSSASIVPYKNDPRSESDIAVPALKSKSLALSKESDGKTNRQVGERGERQQRTTHHAPKLADPGAFLASIQGMKLQAPKGQKMPPASKDTGSAIDKKTHGTTETTDIPRAQIALTNTAPESVDLLGSTEIPLTTASASVENDPVLDTAQGSSSATVSETSGHVSLAFLRSLNINFTPEQLRQLVAHSRVDSIPDTTSEASTIFNENGLIQPSAEYRPDTGSSVRASVVPLVDYASSNSDSTPTSPRLANANNTTIPGQLPPVPLTSNKNLSNDTQMRRGVLEIAPIAKPTPIPVTDHPTSCDLTGASDTKQRLPSTKPSALAISRSEALRQEREMIIGSQVYRNRYSHVAGTLVDKFKALTLTESTPTATPSTVARKGSSTPNQDMLAVNAPPTAPRLPSATPLQRPRFIPNEPARLGIEITPPLLNSTSLNSGYYFDRLSEPDSKNQPARTTRSSGLSLPSHLMGKTANIDTGAAARAQYGK